MGMIRKNFTPITIFFWIITTGLIGLLITDNNSYSISTFLLFFWFLFYIGGTPWFSSIVSLKYEKFSTLKETDPEIKWIVVLGGGGEDGFESTSLSSESIKNLLEGVQLYQNIPNAKVIISSGNSGIKSRKCVAENMGRLAAGFGISKNNLVVESFTKDPIGAAFAIKDLVKKEPFYLVTQSQLMPRFMAIFRKVGLRPIAATSDLPIYELNKFRHKLSIHPFLWYFIWFVCDEIYETKVNMKQINNQEPHKCVIL